MSNSKVVEIREVVMQDQLRKLKDNVRNARSLSELREANRALQGFGLGTTTQTVAQPSQQAVHTRLVEAFLSLGLEAGEVADAVRPWAPLNTSEARMKEAFRQLFDGNTALAESATRGHR